MKRVLFFAHHIQRKMTLFIFGCAFIPLLALSLLSYHKSTLTVREQLQDYNRYAMHQLETITNMHLKEMDAISRDIQSYLLAPGRKITSEPATYAEYQEMNHFLDFLSFHVSQIVEGLYVYTPDGQMLTSRNMNTRELIEMPWWKEYSSDGGWQWTGFHDGSYYSSPRPGNPLISLIVPIQLKAGVPIGSRIVVDVNAREMLALFRSYEMDTNSYLEIRDAEGSLMYRTEGEHPESERDIEFQRTLELNGWQITARVPYEEFNRSTLVIRNDAILISILSLIAAFLLARWLSANLTRRIVTLNQSMLEFSNGNLDKQVEVRGDDELSRLGHRFNLMTREIRELVANITRTEQLKKEAELRALHYQINPHLILNTLNAIQWRARIAGRTDIDRMIYHLGALLSENLDIRQELVPLEEELATIGHYLKIQYYRYGEAFTYIEDVEPGLEQALIPRMTLQPLFENIFYHAFDDGDGIITLEIFRGRDHIVLLLSDNGKGVAPGAETIRPAPPLKGRGGLGMYNVDHKIKLHFGEDYGIRIMPDVTDGAMIEIRLPFLEKETTDDENENGPDRG